MTTMYSRRADRILTDASRSGTETWRDQGKHRPEPPMGPHLVLLAWVLPILAGGAIAIWLLDWIITELAR
jgi:hypothetical protein